MSVLIKGIQMPKNGWTDIRLFYDGSLTMPTGNRPYYKLLTTVEIPVPHGRLLDADDVFNVLTSYYHHSTDFQHEALKEALARVSTIIPAEEGE